MRLNAIFNSESHRNSILLILFFSLLWSLWLVSQFKEPNDDATFHIAKSVGMGYEQFKLLGNQNPQIQYETYPPLTTEILKVLGLITGNPVFNFYFLTLVISCILIPFTIYHISKDWKPVALWFIATNSVPVFLIGGMLPQLLVMLFTILILAVDFKPIRLGLVALAYFTQGWGGGFLAIVFIIDIALHLVRPHLLPAIALSLPLSFNSDTAQLAPAFPFFLLMLIGLKRFMEKYKDAELMIVICALSIGGVLIDTRSLYLLYLIEGFIIAEAIERFKIQKKWVWGIIVGLSPLWYYLQFLLR